MKLRPILALMVVFCFTWFLISLQTMEQTKSPAEKVASGLELVFTQSIDCKSCHTEIYAEWQADQHATAWTEPKYVSFTEEHSRAECLNCHAPQPMLEVGIEKEPVLRINFREDGVDCITCHVRDGRTFGSLGSGAPCGGTKHEAFGSSMACYHCHSAHNLFKEYLASAQYKQGITCQDCHMEAVTRPIVNGGQPRKTRRHFMHAGGHDEAALKKVLELNLKIENQELIVTVTNVGAAHGVPGEINNRRIRLEVSIQVPKGKEEVFGEMTEVVDEVVAYQTIFTPPPRFMRDKIPSTQIMPGEPRLLRYPVPVPHGRVKAFLEFILEKDLFDKPLRMVNKELEF